jgi:succinate dehydrogenase / fumarate reductase, membrane anchor subunit
MVNSATGFSSNGVRDWLVQRVSAVLLGLYTLLLFVLFLTHPSIDYATWQGLFTQSWMKVATLLALLSLFAHAWIGIWTVLTDYIKPTGLRLPLEILVIIALLIYLLWGIDILWSV